MKRVVALLLIVGVLALPAPAGANHEIQQVIDTVNAVSREAASTVANNTPFAFSGFLRLDDTAGTWSLGCFFPGPCALSTQGVLDPDTHVGPVDTAACPVRRGTGTGIADPPFGTIGGEYDRAELHDLRLTVTAAAVVLEGAWRDDAGRGDRFLAVFAAPPSLARPVGCPSAPQHGTGVTGLVWAVGLVR